MNGRTDNCGPLQFDHRDGCAIENIFLALSSSARRQLLVSARGTILPFISRRRIRLYLTRLFHASVLWYHKSLVLEARIDRALGDGYCQATFSRRLLTRRNLYTSRPIYGRGRQRFRASDKLPREFTSRVCTSRKWKSAHWLAYTCITLRRKASGLESISHAVSGVNQPR